MLIPAEALYAVVEVKSVLSAAELDTCMRAAMKIRALRPFKRQFIPAPLEGQAWSGESRCQYIVFAYRSNLIAEDWHSKEYQRIKEAAEKAGCSEDVVDRIVVLDRGMIRPQVSLCPS